MHKEKSPLGQMSKLRVLVIENSSSKWAQECMMTKTMYLECLFRSNCEFNMLLKASINCLITKNVCAIENNFVL